MGRNESYEEGMQTPSCSKRRRGRPDQAIPLNLGTIQGLSTGCGLCRELSLGLRSVLARGQAGSVSVDGVEASPETMVSM